MPNIDLKYSHEAELLQSLLVAMVTVFPWKERSSSQRTFVPIMNQKYFHVVELLHNSFVAMVKVVTIAARLTSDIFCPKEHMCLMWT